jgi:hypothetical protein
MPSKVHVVKPNLCPTCGYTLNAVGDINNKEIRAPRCGDASICISCGELLEFNEDLSLKKISAEVIIALGKESLGELLEFQEFIRNRTDSELSDEDHIVH